MNKRNYFLSSGLDEFLSFMVRIKKRDACTACPAGLDVIAAAQDQLSLEFIMAEGPVNFGKLLQVNLLALHWTAMMRWVARKLMGRIKKRDASDMGPLVWKQALQPSLCRLMVISPLYQLSLEFIMGEGPGFLKGLPQQPDTEKGRLSRNGSSSKRATAILSSTRPSSSAEATLMDALAEWSQALAGSPQCNEFSQTVTSNPHLDLQLRERVMTL